MYSFGSFDIILRPIKQGQAFDSGIMPPPAIRVNVCLKRQQIVVVSEWVQLVPKTSSKVRHSRTSPNGRQNGKSFLPFQAAYNLYAFQNLANWQRFTPPPVALCVPLESSASLPLAPSSRAT